jgi:hypothetical protein
MNTADASSLKFWEGLADVGTWLVIIGVAGEVVEIVLNILKHILKNKKFLDYHKKHKFCIEILGMVFWLMVVVGLCVELKGGHESKKISVAENSRLTKQLNDTTHEAAVLNDRAFTNELQVAVLTNETVRLKLDLELAGSNNVVQQKELILLQNELHETKNMAVKANSLGVTNSINLAQQAMAIAINRPIVRSLHEDWYLGKRQGNRRRI